MQQPWVDAPKLNRKDRRRAEAIARGANPDAPEKGKRQRSGDRANIFEKGKIIEKLQQELVDAKKVTALLCPNPRPTHAHAAPLLRP